MQESTQEKLNGSKSRYSKGLELYKSRKVSIGDKGLFKVSGYYDVDTEKMTCTCPDYRTRKETCKHLYASMLFTKNRGKQTVEHLDEVNCRYVTTNSNGNSSHKDTESIKDPSKNHATKPQEAHSKDFSRQSTITRLAVINSAIELLKTHRKPIELAEVISLASQLETWALSK